MPNVQAPQSQYDSIEADGQSEIVNVPIDVEDDEDDEDYNLSDFSESDDDIIEDFGMEDDGINRAIGGKQLKGVWNGEGDSDHRDSDELRSAEGSRRIFLERYSKMQCGVPLGQQQRILLTSTWMS